MKRFKITYRTTKGPRTRHVEAATPEEAKQILQEDYSTPIKVVSVVLDPVRFSNAETQFQTKMLDTRVRRWR